ncbi:integrator complex subunit 13-like [Babylonia areolata]|uniref:integrator complex subunit 13-like n=1 Tax=Babylonia areolata TaxID=304850 RepID=UPI003FD094B5
MFPVSHKTVFVLDHSSYFAQPCGEKMNYDMYSRNKAPPMGVIPAAHINKPLWTCSVECLFEYMRIVFDIYPTNKLIRVVVGGQSLNSWAHKEMNMNQLAVGLANVGPPFLERGGGSGGGGGGGGSLGGSEDEEYSAVTGLNKAVEALCQVSPAQEGYMAGEAHEDTPLVNKGRIICFTHLKSEGHVRSMEECVVETVNQQNKLAAASESVIPINHVEVIFIHITPVKEPPYISERPKREVSSEVTCELHVTQSGTHLYYKMIELVQKHYDLASTTVTGIPMKEEQNAQSSANYDVELLHPAVVHSDLIRQHQEQAETTVVIPSREGLPPTITLKWCTPKSNVVELHHCTGSYRITPVDVNSRPSACLTNFLLSGRAVMLEQPRKTGVKVISHMLASHGGEIFIHILPTGRSILEDPPSISEGCGGRVTDYRITDFGDFMKEHKLVPAPPGFAADLGVKPFQKALDRLERSSRFWPIVITESILGNLQMSIGPLQSLLVKEELTDDEVLECKKAVYGVVSMESKNEALPVSAVGSRGKGPKREEQYRQLWGELENLVRAYSDTSPQHAKVLECVLECKKPGPPGDDPHLSMPKVSDSKPPAEERGDGAQAEQGWKDLDRFQKMTEREKQELHKGDKVISPPPPKKSRTEELLMKPGGQNLLSMWASRLKTLHNKRHAEFAGRVDYPDTLKAKLYVHLEEEENGDQKPDIKSLGNQSKSSDMKPVQGR